MSSQHPNATRYLCWQAPVFYSILGFLCVGTANAEMNTTQLSQSPAPAPLNLGEASGQHPGLNQYIPGTAVLLEFFIRYFASILDDPTLEEALFNGNEETLVESADLLIIGYPMFGIQSDLSNSKIQTSLDDAYIIIEMLENEPELIKLDEQTQTNLNATVKAMIGELENGERSRIEAPSS